MGSLASTIHIHNRTFKQEEHPKRRSPSPWPQLPHTVSWGTTATDGCGWSCCCCGCWATSRPLLILQLLSLLLLLLLLLPPLLLVVLLVLLELLVLLVLLLVLLVLGAESNVGTAAAGVESPPPAMPPDSEPDNALTRLPPIRSPPQPSPRSPPGPSPWPRWRPRVWSPTPQPSIPSSSLEESDREQMVGCHGTAAAAVSPPSLPLLSPPPADTSDAQASSLVPKARDNMGLSEPTNPNPNQFPK